ncbi:regulatory protein [Bacteroides heparinolyticus]|uniref:Regulatory protein n=1 Tax=Prevotella heparinolytica TaxID=28113 RepID=A0A449I4H3_9BACE|nr:P63C domain-containing protein [Bacteroides heparinolyticus]VFB14363.1 regulatory protein [Bacteroides heparinolyticus]
MNSRIKELLKQKGITQKELAKAIGKSEISISKYVNGEKPSSKTELAIADFLGVSIKDLYEEEIEAHTLVSKYEGELHIGDKVLPCAVLDNNTRILTATSVFEAFDRPRKGKSNESYRVDQMPSFINANNLQPFVDEQLIEWTRLIEYQDLKGNRKQGYNARILRGLCKVYIDARKAKVLLKSQERFADIAEIILYALSDVGIVALVDEATGYDKVKNRAKDELQKFFKEALQEEAGKWVKTFNDSFFEMIYRMRGWNWTGASKKPSVVGIWINDIVYERIAPALLYELRKLNPKNEKGNRPYKHHQFLTEELGHPKLKEHISGVMAIGRLSNNNWAVFMRNLDKAYPKMYQQLDIDFDFDGKWSND